MSTVTQLFERYCLQREAIGFQFAMQVKWYSDRDRIYTDQPSHKLDARQRKVKPRGKAFDRMLHLTWIGAPDEFLMWKNEIL
jgi:hypothetical protein